MNVSVDYLVKDKECEVNPNRKPDTDLDELIAFRLEANVNTYAAFMNEVDATRPLSHDFRYDINHDKITARLGWKPKYTFGDSVRETVKWYLENQDWVQRVKTGEYKNWIDTYYGKSED